MPAPGSADYEAYNEWLHYSEGSAMLPLMLNLYVARLKEAGAPLHPRIDSEIAKPPRLCRRRAEGHANSSSGTSLTGADIQMSFVGEMAKVVRQARAVSEPRGLADADACAAGVPALGREGRGVSVRELGLRRCQSAVYARRGVDQQLRNGRHFAIMLREMDRSRLARLEHSASPSTALGHGYSSVRSPKRCLEPRRLHVG